MHCSDAGYRGFISDCLALVPQSSLPCAARCKSRQAPECLPQSQIPDVALALELKSSQPPPTGVFWCGSHELDLMVKT